MCHRWSKGRVRRQCSQTVTSLRSPSLRLQLRTRRTPIGTLSLKGWPLWQAKAISSLAISWWRCTTFKFANPAKVKFPLWRLWLRNLFLIFFAKKIFYLRRLAIICKSTIWSVQCLFFLTNKGIITRCVHFDSILNMTISQEQRSQTKCGMNLKLIYVHYN